MKRKDSPPGAKPLNDPADGVVSDGLAQARTRARRRLIGAVVLVAAGIIGFPLVFETQPRPVPVDIPIAIPRKDGAAPLVMPPAPASVPATAVLEPVSPPDEEIITESRADAGRDLTPTPAPKPGRAAGAEPKPDARLAAAAASPPPAEVPPKTSPDAPAAADGARAEALLEGKDAGKATDASRFIVQVGAFSEAAAAREARLKAEKLGLKTYTQVADTPGGSRIRVRVGPFASRDDADKALAKARAAGLGGVVLVL